MEIHDIHVYFIVPFIQKIINLRNFNTIAYSYILDGI